MALFQITGHEIEKGKTAPGIMVSKGVVAVYATPAWPF